jgi:hypothetical protein
MNLPFLAHLSQSTVAPKFSGKKEDWPDFLRKYEVWVRNMAFGSSLTDAENIQLFNSCLPEMLQDHLQLEEKIKARQLTYVEFRAILEAKYGRAQSENMRQRWKDVQMPPGPGKYSTFLFDVFMVKFETAWNDVPDATQEEA